MDRQRMSKARRIYKDMAVQEIEAGMHDLGDFLDDTAGMAEESGAYPGFDSLIVLEDESDSDFEEGRRRHKNLTKALDEYLEWYGGGEYVDGD